jgi:hypothetical protein
MKATHIRIDIGGYTPFIIFFLMIVMIVGATTCAGHHNRVERMKEDVLYIKPE